MDLTKYAQEPLETVENKLLVTLVIDTSVEMNLGLIDIVNKSLTDFFRDFYLDERYLGSLELAIIESHNNVIIRRVPKLLDADHPTQTPRLEATAVKSSLMQSIETAIELCKARKAFYRQEGNRYYRPNIIVLSHGDINNYSEETLKRINAEMKNKEYSIHFYAGDKANSHFVSNVSKHHFSLNNSLSLFYAIDNIYSCLLLESDNYIPRDFLPNFNDSDIDWLNKFEI